MDFGNYAPMLYIAAGFAFLITIGHGFACRRHWRERRRLHALHRGLWGIIFALLAFIGAGLGTAVIGYKRLVAEQQVALVTTRQLAPQQFAVRIDVPNGDHNSAELRGDEWELDARVIKWKPRAVELGAPPLYRLDRLSGRYRNVEQEKLSQRSAIGLSGENAVDLWQLKHRYPDLMPWFDADYGSGTYLPMIDGGQFNVTISPVGGLIARPADAATAAKIKAAGW
jgi:hypothetical protein